MNLNDFSHLLPTRAVPREQTQALLDQRSAAAGLIKPSDRHTLADRLEQQAREQGERTFLIYGEQVLSYLEVDARANQMAHTFTPTACAPVMSVPWPWKTARRSSAPGSAW